MADTLLPAPASITSQECDCKWVRGPMGGSVLRLDILRDAVSFDCNIKSARGHTSIHMTPWESHSYYKRWNEGSYPPRDKTRQLIENFRAAERRTRAILNSRRISLNRTTRVGWMCTGRCSDTFFRGSANTDYQYETRNEAAYRNHQRSALPPSEGMPGEDRMGQENLAARHPLDPQMDEDALHLSEGRAPTVAGLGPHSPDSISSSLIPYGMGEDSSPEENQGQQDQTPEQMEAEEEGNLPMEEATSKLRMGLHVGPAKYQPASPKYIRAEEEEEEEEDCDVEAPYLAPRDRARAKDCPEDGPLTSSSESIPALIDLNEEIPPCQMLTSPRPGNAVRPATLELDKKATVILAEYLLPPLLSSDKEKPEKGSTPNGTREGPVPKEEVPEESIIYIDDYLEPSPLAKMGAQIDKLKMPPPVDNTLIAAGTLLAISQGPLAYTKADLQRRQSLERRRNGVKKLQDRRKARKPLKLDIQAVAKMRTGPRDVHCSQELARLASAVVPLPQLDTVADDINSNTPRPETPPPQKNQ